MKRSQAIHKVVSELKGIKEELIGGKKYKSIKIFNFIRNF